MICIRHQKRSGHISSHSVSPATHFSLSNVFHPPSIGGGKMPSAAASTGLRGVWTRNRGLIVPALMSASILVVVVPLPAGLLDLLLSAHIPVSVLILLTTLYVGKP